MIETQESREQFLERRERAQKALKCAMGGELNLGGEATDEAKAGKSSATAEKVPVGSERLTISPIQKPKFDRVAYQREYMRNRRAQLKLAGQK